jgi:hypothetical protein
VNPLLNSTKWDELRAAMYGLDTLSPQWRTQDLKSGYLSPWDGDWFYHFRASGYSTIEWVEIKTTTAEQTAAVLAALKSIHVPGHRSDHGFKVYGYSREGSDLEYIGDGTR